MKTRAALPQRHAHVENAAEGALASVGSDWSGACHGVGSPPTKAGHTHGARCWPTSNPARERPTPTTAKDESRVRRPSARGVGHLLEVPSITATDPKSVDVSAMGRFFRAPCDATQSSGHSPEPVRLGDRKRPRTHLPDGKA